MAFADLVKEIRGMFSRVRGDSTRRPDGGTSHYRPMRRKGTEEPVPAAGQQPEGNVPYVHTGFTGMNPPVNYGYDPAFGQTRFGGAMGNDPLRGETGYFGGQADGRTSRQDNISYMPGYGPSMRDHGIPHVEHIMALTGLKSCYEAIECMKNGETLIVTLDAIANESESMRCQDMLAGAAFTLGCTVRLLGGARIVVIAPEGVVILPEQAQPEAIRPPEMMTARMAAGAEEQRPVRRERRSGVGSADWNAARSGQMDNYNPYTGTMPVAAGAYGSFGGYR